MLLQHHRGAAAFQPIAQGAFTRTAAGTGSRAGAGGRANHVAVAVPASRRDHFCVDTPLVSVCGFDMYAGESGNGA